MHSHLNIGRRTGFLLLVQLVGLILPFVLLLPLTADPRGYLVSAGGTVEQTKFALLLLLGNGALTVGVSITLFGTLRRRGEGMALWLLVASVLMLVLQAVDNVQVLSMLSLAEAHSRAGGSEAAFPALATMVGATRTWTHTIEILFIDVWILLLYVALFRFSLVPRVLSGLGIVTVLLHAAGIPIRRFIGIDPVAMMGIPMALSHVLLALWLLVRGFADRAAAALLDTGPVGG